MQCAIYSLLLLYIAAVSLHGIGERFILTRTSAGLKREVVLSCCSCFQLRHAFFLDGLGLNQMVVLIIP